MHLKDDWGVEMVVLGGRMDVYDKDKDRKERHSDSVLGS